MSANEALWASRGSMAAAYLASKPIHFEHKNGCSGKVGFASRSDAKKTADKRRLNKDPYQCKNCGSWHLTSRGFSAWL